MENAGYTIIDMIRTTSSGRQNKGFAIAHRPKAPSPYVTWRYTESEPGEIDFFSGNYFSDERKARQDFHLRIADSYSFKEDDDA